MNLVGWLGWLIFGSAHDRCKYLTPSSPFPFPHSFTGHETAKKEPLSAGEKQGSNVYFLPSTRTHKIAASQCVRWDCGGGRQQQKKSFRNRQFDWSKHGLHSFSSFLSFCLHLHPTHFLLPLLPLPLSFSTSFSFLSLSNHSFPE